MAEHANTRTPPNAPRMEAPELTSSGLEWKEEVEDASVAHARQCSPCWKCGCSGLRPGLRASGMAAAGLAEASPSRASGVEGELPCAVCAGCGKVFSRTGSSNGLSLELGLEASAPVEEEVEPKAGDTVYVVGHGPAVLVEITPAGPRGAMKYQVRYPNGTTYHVPRKNILAHEAPQASQVARSHWMSLVPLSSPHAVPDSGPRHMEYFGRAFDDPGRNITTPSAVFSLVATMVGGGVLSLPYAMSQCGLALGSIALFLSALCSAWTLDMLVECARRTGRDTFELVGHAAFGTIGRQVTVSMVFLICWLAFVAYLVLLGDLLVPIVELVAPAVLDYDPKNLRRAVVTVATVVSAPMCFKTSLHTLRFLCFASVGSVAVVGLVIVRRALEHLGEPHMVWITLPSRGTAPVLTQGGYLWWPADWWQALYVFPMFGVSFLCHFNALPTHQELHQPTRLRVRRVWSWTMLSTSLIYLVVGVSGYLWACSSTCGNILQNFSRDDSLVAGGRGALGMVLMLNFPLLCQPCRNAVYRLIMGFPCCAAPVSSSTTLPCPAATSDSPSARAPPSSPPPARVHVYRREETRHIDRRQASLASIDSFLPKNETVQQSAAEPTPLQRAALTIILLSSALAVSLFLSSVLVVWSILGSTVCFLVGYILPAAFWCRIVGPSTSAWKRRAARGLVGCTTVLAVACTYMTIVRLDMPPCPYAGDPLAPGRVAASAASTLPVAAVTQRLVAFLEPVMA